MINQTKAEDVVLLLMSKVCADETGFNPKQWEQENRDNKHEGSSTTHEHTCTCITDSKATI